MIAITGGGTGGHLAIAKAICEEYNKRGIRPIYIGSNNGQDRKWFEGYPGFSKTYFLQSSGVVNKKGLSKVLSLTNIIKQSFTCKKIFNEHKIDKVFSVGGYSAAPASFASILTKTPLFIHEQNAVLGKLNKLLKPFAKEVFGSYGNATFKTPYPISERFFSTARKREKIKTILFLGGSQGASSINSLSCDLAVDLKEMGLNIIHQCGEKDFQKLKEFYSSHDIEVDLFAFCDELHLKMQEADFAISRAGASSLWELVASNLPTLFIPFPYAAADHQYFNAKFFADIDLAFLFRQNEIEKKKVLDIIKNANVDEISQNLALKIANKGAKTIVDKMENEI